jgi:UDP-glucose 4-epimerase
MSASTSVILVTGGCGYLGSQLIRDLAADGGLDTSPTIRVLDNMQSGRYRSLMELPAGRYEFVEGDILDAKTTHKALGGVSAVVHLAAVTGTPMGFYGVGQAEQTNHWGTVRLVESCLQRGVKRFIYASSAAVYGPGGPYTEADRCRPVGPYAQSKLHGEDAVVEAGAQGLAYTILRFGTMYGIASAIRFDAVANRFAYLAGIGRTLTIYGHGHQRRPFVHVRDASAAVRFCLRQPEETGGRVLNVVGDNPSVLNLVQVVRELRPRVLVDHQEQDSITRLSFEVDATALTELGCPPEVTLRAGMAELLNGFTYLSSPEA